MTLLARIWDGGVAAWVGWALALDVIDRVEFFLLVPDPFGPLMLAFFFADLVLVPTGRLAPEPRFRFLITSVFKLRGLTTPCSLRNSPHALQSGWPSGFRRHSGVVCVKQFVQVVGTLLSP